MASFSKNISDDPLAHPLMPGVRCAELWNPAWPRALHDAQLSGFSPLICDMEAAPQVWATVDVGGELNWVEAVEDREGKRLLLVNDGRLRRVEEDGEVRWTSGEGGGLLFFGDLRGDGRDRILLGAGPRLALLDAESGETEWARTFEPAHAQVRVAVGEVLPERTGLEVAVFLAYHDWGCLLHFPPIGEPEVVWEKIVVVPDEWPERADHGCSIQLDLSVRDEPLIWNVRHHRCRGFDARTGEMISSLVYDIGGGQRRNYGPWSFGTGEGGRGLICVVAEQIQTHVHTVRLNRSGPSELAWEHYYGEVYVVPGVVVRKVAVADLDGDGETEIAYNARDPEREFRSFVRVRRADDGAIKAELEDRWCAGVVSNLGEEGRNGLLVHPAPDGSMPEQGDLEVYLFEEFGELRQVGVVEKGAMWGTPTLKGERGNDLLVRQVEAGGDTALVRYAVKEDALVRQDSTSAEGLLEAPLRLVLEAERGEDVFLAIGRRGTLEGLNWNGERLWEIPLLGGSPPVMSAADLDGDGSAELVAVTVGHRVRVLDFDAEGIASEEVNREFYGPRQRLGPLLYDLEGDGSWCLIAPGRTADGRVMVRVFRADGGLLWETALDATTDDGGKMVAWNAGRFLSGGRTAVAASVINSSRTVEGTFLLDGATGEVLWFKDLHWEGEIVRGFMPTGMPTAFDVDGDGVEEIGMDLYSYMAWVRGDDGSFVRLHHGPNIRPEGALYAAMLYNSYCPVYRNPEDTEPHWFVPLGYGTFGLMNPEPTDGPWREELGYDVPPRVGLVDVDGDGVMEVGYAAQNDPVFKCRDLWSGEVKWELELPQAPNSPVIAADVDGDGKGEFLVGQYCIGTDADGRGEIRWEAPVPLGWAIIADFDGDGKGEIACASQGKIYILKGGI